jgi:NADP-dependent 3-hydroxy acid dehydrogenase YdfG
VLQTDSFLKSSTLGHAGKDRMMSTSNGKTAIVTGAGSGIGRDVAKLLASDGIRVMVVGRRVEPLESLVAEINADGGEAIAHSADLEDGDSAAGVASIALEKFGRIDILINNAGHASKVRSIRWIQPDEWESVFKINIDAVYRLTQACLPDMLSRNEGTVITTSSMAALTPGILGGAPYSAAKAASYNLMRGLTSELRSQGIRATTILPGEVNTPILDGRPAPPDSDARNLMMLPIDVARTIHFVATMPHRTLIEEIVMTPTIPRDMEAEMKVAREAGKP